MTQIEVTVRDPERVRITTDAIRRAFPGAPLIGDRLAASNDSFFTAVAVEKNVMFLILTLIILVAAFNVMSSLIMMVKDKRAISRCCARSARRAGRSCASS